MVKGNNKIVRTDTDKYNMKINNELRLVLASIVLIIFAINLSSAYIDTPYPSLSQTKNFSNEDNSLNYVTENITLSPDPTIRYIFLPKYGLVTNASFIFRNSSMISSFINANYSNASTSTTTVTLRNQFGVSIIPTTNIYISNITIFNYARTNLKGIAIYNSSGLMDFRFGNYSNNFNVSLYMLSGQKYRIECNYTLGGTPTDFPRIASFSYGKVYSTYFNITNFSSFGVDVANSDYLCLESLISNYSTINFVNITLGYDGDLTPVFYHNTLLNTTNKTDFTIALSNYTTRCSNNENTYLYPGSTKQGCRIPINFYSGTNFNLEYLNISITDFGYEENSQTYNITTYETSTETFRLNISIDPNLYTTQSATLVYNGTAYTSTSSLQNGKVIFTSTIDIPLSISSYQNNTFYWNISLSNSSGTTYYQTSIKNQTVYPIYFSLCNSTNRAVYVNFTFKDESNSNSLSAFTDLSTWTYYLGGGTRNKTLLYSNQVYSNSSYAFCLLSNNQTMKTVLQYYQYSATGFPQRQFYYSGPLTNSTTNQILYLLNASAGVYTTFIANTQSGGTIPGVTVQVYRQISGLNTLISQGITDAAGASTYWLNPNYDHTVIFSKNGYNTQSLTLRPTQSTYTVVMNGGTSNASFSQYLSGVEWTHYPSQGVLQPNTTYTFGLNITADYGDITRCKLELLNNTAFVLTTVSGCSAYGGNISVNYNTGNNQVVFMKFYIDQGSGYVVLDPFRYWVDATNVSSYYTIKSFFESLNTFSEDFGGTDVRNNYTKLIAFFIVLTIIIGFISYNFGTELTNPGWNIIIMYGVILFASIAGFFTVDYYSSFQNIGFSVPWIDKYFIAFILGLYVAGFFMSKFRRENA